MSVSTEDHPPEACDIMKRTGTDHHSFTWELDGNMASCAQNPEVGSQDPQSGRS